MDNPNVRAQQTLLRSTDRYRFAVAKAMRNDESSWLAERFGEHFYVQWKICKDRFTKSKGAVELGSLESVVKSAVVSCNKENPHYTLQFVALRGAYDIVCNGVGLGTVLQSSQLTDPLLNEIVILKANKVCEYVRDSQGTVVNRYVYRAVGNDTGKALGYRQSGMYASGVADATRKTDYYAYTEVKATKGSKAVTRSMAEHVMGWKPSMFLSFTTIAKGASNPKGDAFGDVIVKIDLMELKTRGITFTYLGTKEGALLLAKEVTGKSGAGKQAFEDITRTKEVLVEGWVPPEALCSISCKGEIVWAKS